LCRSARTRSERWRLDSSSDDRSLCAIMWDSVTQLLSQDGLTGSWEPVCEVRQGHPLG
jgi:hypothetical protein